MFSATKSQYDTETGTILMKQQVDVQCISANVTNVSQCYMCIVYQSGFNSKLALLTCFVTESMSRTYKSCSWRTPGKKNKWNGIRWNQASASIISFPEVNAYK